MWKAVDIDTDAVRKFTVREQKRDMSNGSINRSISALRRMFNLARQDGALRTVPYFPMLKEAPPRQGFFERDQYGALFRALPDYLRLPLALGYFTAMRLAEVLNLEWGQVNLFENTITLRDGETKNGSGRVIPIVPQLRLLIDEQRARRKMGCDLVCFRVDQDGRTDRIKGFRKAWYSACRKVGLGKMVAVIDQTTGKALFDKPRGPRSKPKAKMRYEGMIFHDLRRTGVRNLVRAGVPERVAQAISGHKTRAVFERYNIVSGNDVIEAGRKLSVFHQLGDKSGTVKQSEAQQPQLIQ